MKTMRGLMALVLCAVTTTAVAQEDNSPWEEYSKLIDAKKSVATLGPTLFGDQVSLLNGALSFSQTDVSLPGNSALPVAFTRTFTVTNRKGTSNNALLADWDLDLPRISGVFAPTWPDHRCSVSTLGEAQPPEITVEAALFTAQDYWQGIRADMPGGGELLLATSTTQQPSAGGPYYWVTQGLTYFSCLPTIQNATGEGFVAVTADGTTYRFDWLAQYVEPRLKDDKFPTLMLTRKRNVLYATRVEDRFGNWVNYTYTNAATAPARLTAIDANDGRHLSLSYNAQGHVASVSNGSQTWAYTYDYPTSITGTLTSVTLPDQSQWTLSFAALSRAVINNSLRGEPNQPLSNCWDPGDVRSPAVTGTLTHPSGAVGAFTVAPTRHGRSNVPQECVNYDGLDNVADDYAYYPMVYDAFSLTQKTLSGPGLTAATWTYAYTSDQSFADGTGPVCTTGDCGAPVCLDDACAGTAVTTVSGPGEWTRYTHGNSYRYNEGLLLKVERGSGPTAILNTQTTSYELAQSGQPFPTPIGSSIQPRNDSFGAQSLLPQRRNVIVQDGATFTWQVDACGTTACFDAFARPTRVVQSSSLGFSKTESTAYADNTSLWVLGQVASVTDVGTGKKLSETTYDALARPITRKAFGLLKQTLTYNADGTVATVGDGNGHITTLGGWMRGIPQSIRFADNSTRAAVVDGLGQITSTTDELGTITSYTYDAMGRLASLSLPGWTSTTFSFVPVASLEFGLPAGHWRLTETTGSYKKTTYFDGRFRPLLTQEEDTANTASKRFTRRAFDHDNRETYASYPAASDPGLGAGTSTSYDALGRVTSTSQTSELGTLSTSTAYLSGFQTRTSNPRGQITTVSFQAFDTPDTSAPVLIVGPDGVTTTIARDGFGMPLSVTRSGTYAGVPVSATRNYVYDGFERLCKRIEPEAGGTLFQYDGVGNLIGSAEGQSASLSCDAIPAGARIGRSYDARDRLLSVTYPNAPTTVYTYAADGALVKLDQGITTWFYGYNNRRLLTSELLTVGADATPYDFNYGYTALGHLTSVSTPSGLSIDYAPNALGQPTKAGTFASGATYFPDGSLKQFTYGNGLIHTVTQNARHLPSQVRDASGSTVVHDFGYSYDANGNVTAINDVGQSGLQTRSLLYDARDRLVSATATQLWGVASYAYDPLDNLRLADQGSRQYRYQYDSNNRLTQLTDPAGAALPGLDFAYDAQGRQIRKGTQVRTFDGANRITAIDGETYAYDGTGRRIATWAADGRTKVEVYTQDGKLAFAVDSAKGGGSSFIYLAGQRIAQDHWVCPDQHTVTYFHADALGSPVATTDAAKNVLERTYYAPYGEALNRSVDGPGYTGHVMDAATGLVYAQQRYYDPVVGKFLSIDPVQADPDSGSNFNRFWYANNNPYRYTDPDGRAPPGCGDGTCEKPKPAAPDRRSITFKSPGSKAFLATSARTVVTGAAEEAGAARALVSRTPLLLPLLLSGDTPTRNNNRKPDETTVRLQAQGNGLESSVVINSGPNGIVTSADGLIGLGTLRESLAPRDVDARVISFMRAERFINNAAAGGGIGPSKTSFPAGPRTDVRVDVEVLRGRAFILGPPSDATIR